MFFTNNNSKWKDANEEKEFVGFLTWYDLYIAKINDMIDRFCWLIDEAQEKNKAGIIKVTKSLIEHKILMQKIKLGELR